MSSNDFSIDVMNGSCWIQRPWLVRRSWCLYGWRQCLPCWTHWLTGIKDFFITITIKQNTCTVWGIWSVVAHYSSLLDDLIWILFPVLHLTPVCFPAFYWLGFVPCSTLCCSVSLVSSLLDELLLILCPVLQCPEAGPGVCGPGRELWSLHTPHHVSHCRPALWVSTPVHSSLLQVQKFRE